MCIISALPRGTEKNSEKTRKFISNGFNCNKDGSGYMFKRRGQSIININKGFFNLGELLQAIEDENLQLDDELVIHHRISTAGKVSKENCHPFVLSKIHNEVAATKIAIDKPCLVHNGHFSKLSYFQDLDRDFSDTYAFSRYILSNEKLRTIMDTDDDLFDTLTDGIIGHSKVCILYPEKDRNMFLLGDFIEDEGYYHSNTGYCRQTYDRGGSSSQFPMPRGHFSEGFGLHGDFYPDDDGDAENDAASERMRLYQANKAFAEKTKAETSNKTSLLLRLDGTTLQLSNKNCNHFNFVLKSEYAKCLLDRKFEFSVMKSYDSKAELQGLTYKDTDSSRTYELQEAVSTIKLNNAYFFLPKADYSETYRQYLDLLKKDKTPGKQTLKKLTKLLEKNVVLDNTRMIYYIKYKEMFLKSSLLAYKDYLENLFEKQTKWEEAEEAKIININTVNDAIDAGQPVDVINALKDVEQSNKEFLKSLNIDTEEFNTESVNDKLEEDFINSGKNSLQTIVDHLEINT